MMLFTTSTPAPVPARLPIEPMPGFALQSTASLRVEPDQAALERSARTCGLAARASQPPVVNPARNPVLPAVEHHQLRARKQLPERISTTCRVRFGPDDGSVCARLGRIEADATGCG